MVWRAGVVFNESGEVKTASRQESRRYDNNQSLRTRFLQFIGPLLNHASLVPVKNSRLARNCLFVLQQRRVIGQFGSATPLPINQFRRSNSQHQKYDGEYSETRRQP